MRMFTPLGTAGRLALVAIVLAATAPLFAQVNYTANDRVTPNTRRYRSGINYDYLPPWDNFSLTDIAAGNPAKNILGLGVTTARPGLQDKVLGVYGYDVSVSTFDYMRELGMGELTVILGFPSDEHRDWSGRFCGEGDKWNAHFKGIYEPIWDGGANGTPYNDKNLYAAYVYETVSRYKDYVRYWEIWNEPGLYKGDPAQAQKFWGGPEFPGSWWNVDPDPCDYVMHAPIEHYVRVLRISWEIIKTLAPDDYVAISGLGSESFLDAIMRNTDEPTEGKVTAAFPLKGGAYFDVLGYHTYPHIDGSVLFPPTGHFERHSDGAADGMILRRLAGYNSVAEKYGYDGKTYPRKENICTEVNVPRLTFDANNFGGPDAQINFMAKAVIAFKTRGVKQAHFYTISDQKRESEIDFEFNAMGMYKYLPDTPPYQQQIHPAGKALKTVNDLITETDYDPGRSAALAAPDGVRAYAFRRNDGTYVYAVWAETRIDKSESANKTYTFPASVVGGDGRLTRYNWDYAYTKATSTAQAGAPIQLDARPVFFTAGAGATGTTNAAPVPTLAASTASVRTGDAFTVDVSWSESVSGLTTTDFQVSGASITGITGSGNRYTLSLKAAATVGTATVSLPGGRATDTQGLGNVASNTVSVQVTSAPAGGSGTDLELAMSADKTTLGKYQSLTLTLTLRNTGTAAATGIVVKHPKPADYAITRSTTAAGRYSDFSGEWAVGTVPAGSSVTLQVVWFTLTDAARFATAEVLRMDQRDVDSTPGNRNGATPVEDDEAQVAINGGGNTGGGNTGGGNTGGGNTGGGISQGVDLAITLTSPVTTYTRYRPLSLKLVVRNSGTAVATNVRIVTPFPKDFVYTSATATSGSYDAWLMAWTVGTLAAGASATLDLTLYPLQAGPEAVAFVEVATQDGGKDVDSSPGNGRAQTPAEDDEAVLRFRAAAALQAGDPVQLTIIHDVKSQGQYGTHAVTFSLAGSEPLRADLVDLLGRTVRSYTLEGVEGMNRVSIDASGLAPGLYHLAFRAAGRMQAFAVLVE